MTLPPQPNDIDALLEAVPDALADEPATALFQLACSRKTFTLVSSSKKRANVGTR